MRRIVLLARKIGCVIMVLMMVSAAALSAEQEIKTGNEQNQLIRVCLTRLGGRDRLDFTFAAPYQITTDHGISLAFRTGSEVSFQVKNNRIYLYYQEMVQELGEEALLIRSDKASDPMTGVYLTNFPALYMGDLKLDLSEGKLRAILTIHVEDYLLGVVPHEMGDSFPLEALKAQAVAARTYALRHLGQHKDYDLVDNTNDQAFKGYLTGHPLSEQAVRETRGICGYYQGDLAQCFYSASNGGQTELVQSVWNNREPYEYYTFGEDPYDTANPESMVQRFDIMKQYDKETEAPYALKKLMADQLSAGQETAEEGLLSEEIHIDSVSRVMVDSPSAANSKHMTNLHIEAAVTIRKPVTTIDISPEEVHLFESAEASEANTEVQAASANAGTSYMSSSRVIAVDVPVFPVAEAALSLSINSNYQNEIWSVVEGADRFTIEVRRYGHGVGMSQRGAQWMASEHGMTYQEILDFYYPGMELIQFPEQERQFADVEDALLATAGPAPTVTPRPTLMPLTQTAEEGQWYAAVTEIADDSSLNLRAAPGLNSDILLRLYKGQRLLVLKRCPEEGWVHVRTDAAEGYVMERYLTAENEQQ